MSTALVPSHLMTPAGTGNLDAYIQEVYKVPMLTLEEEQELACLYRDRTTWKQRAAWYWRTCVSSCTWPRAIPVTAWPWVI